MEHFFEITLNYFSQLRWYEYVGYGASIFVALSFYMKTIIPLRLLALCSNVTFLVYGLFGGLPPVFLLHLFLFPLNIVRLLQMKNLIEKVRNVAREDYSFTFKLIFAFSRSSPNSSPISSI